MATTPFTIRTDNAPGQRDGFVSSVYFGDALIFTGSVREDAPTAQAFCENEFGATLRASIAKHVTKEAL